MTVYPEVQKTAQDEIDRIVHEACVERDVSAARTVAVFEQMLT